METSHDPEAGRKESEVHNGVEIELFDDSTHSYLLYFGHTRDCTQFFLGAGVIALQIFLYSIMVAEGHDIFKNDRVQVEVVFGADCSVASELICEAEEKGNEYAILGFVLLGIFLMGDVLTAINGFFSVSGIFSKVAACAIIGTSVYAAYAGSVFAFQGVYFGSKYDTIVNCIGVLFINDIDEKFFLAMKEVKFGEKFKSCCSCLCCGCCESTFKTVCVCICLVIFIVIGIAAAESAAPFFL